ncbi:YoeB-YefM toxin-antitoxin system antitoxin YefM [Alysiella filiformis]|uniref:Antitoxin n=1 Tax=Alysiella filiformis DSM 16848 TaxID=1120981 RepID=A0A286E566_9NEIS|nr:YoeB-YefM toxin-antitoxin system antitoxin YefM [Alysiella filiformis]QMT30416.1 YoeB-YefM toxin-antitoxin system antitoxin YefM [Alysiella filiformis]UBQ56602.1 YoeB-YefM toxin-antitoxin system antitoxin YefM [Alysiella filiformis DSM 16848]SOD66033.1 antitoxin YefM [Alysiella filiformis DSM 16848]
MHTLSYSEARQNLAKTMQEVVQNHEPVLITRTKNNEDCVLMSLAHYRSLEETAYLLRSPVNAQRLNQAIQQLKNGNGMERELSE